MITYVTGIQEGAKYNSQWIILHVVCPKSASVQAYEGQQLIIIVLLRLRYVIKVN